MKKILTFIGTLMLFGCANGDTQMLNDLEQYKGVRDKTVYFGHQSVGANIMDGVRDLRLGLDQNIHDFYIGHNSDPLSKLIDFEREIDKGVASGQTIDIVMMKFCYVDIPNDQHMLEEILNAYGAMSARLNNKYPKMKIVHFTVPLTSEPTGAKYQAKKMIKLAIGRSGYNADNNIERNRYNNLLRRRFASELIFDLAAIESQNRQ